MIIALRYLIFSIGLAVFTGCGISDNEAPIPFYLDLQSPSVKSPSDPINDTHKITEAWVFVDNQIIGLFPLPAKVPVVFSDNEVEITILAGIRNNGMNDTPVFYPFYKSIATKIKPVANELINIPLNFEYVNTAKLSINESFEDGNIFSVDLDNKPETFLGVTSDDTALGSKSGVVTLSRNLSFIEVGSAKIIRKGENARGQSYIEFDYKGDGEIAVGIAKSRSGFLNIEYFLFVPGKNDWNKIYVDVTDKLSTDDYDSYFPIIAFTKTGTSQESKLYIDNYKHVHF